jgi:hypothetical protein
MCGPDGLSSRRAGRSALSPARRAQHKNIAVSIGRIRTRRRSGALRPECTWRPGRGTSRLTRACRRKRAHVPRRRPREILAGSGRCLPRAANLNGPDRPTLSACGALENRVRCSTWNSRANSQQAGDGGTIGRPPPAPMNVPRGTSPALARSSSRSSCKDREKPGWDRAGTIELLQEASPPPQGSMTVYCPAVVAANYAPRLTGVCGALSKAGRRFESPAPQLRRACGAKSAGS